jgi:hypothetical protein
MSVYDEFSKWIEQLDKKDLNEIDSKLINMLISNFNEIQFLSTAGGKRAKKIVELINTKHNSTSSELHLTQNNQEKSKAIVQQISEVNIGPFRGFASEERFNFDKKYAFLYGPNGSGKSSLCEGLELALLGDIEEAKEKRIRLVDYIKNAEVNESRQPIIFGINDVNERVEIIPNRQIYRFSFFEKNRIDGFARITAETQSEQKDRIATLFGLESFNKFVDGFTDNFENYLSIENIKEKKFAETNHKYEQDKGEIIILEKDVEQCDTDMIALIDKVDRVDVKTKDDLILFLKGNKTKKGYIDELYEKRTQIIPDDQDVRGFDDICKLPCNIKENIEKYKSCQQRLLKDVANIDYKDMYNAIVSLREHKTEIPNICPACKTPIDMVVVNPYVNAISELENLKSISDTQDQMKGIAKEIIGNTNALSTFLEEMREISKGMNVDLLSFSKMPKVTLSTLEEGIVIEKLLAIIEQKDAFLQRLDELKTKIITNNIKLTKEREAKKNIEAELEKHNGYYDELKRICSKEEDLQKEIGNIIKEIKKFESINKKHLEEIEDEKKLITLKKKYLDSYSKLTSNIKGYRTKLPMELASGLSDKVKEYYNIINNHDPEFELIESLLLPTKSGEKIMLRFQGEKITYDALYILSEGHIKVLGLSILLSKAVKEGLGFLIFDDIVNAIDDDHRSGIAELLMTHDDFRNRQHILTCHGEQFINKLEHKLGVSRAAKEVKRYRFISLNVRTERGIKISIGDPKHYLLQAKMALEKDSLKKAASSCRQAIESLAEILWKKIAKEKNINLSVKLRRPGGKPDLSSLIDSLINILNQIDSTAKINVYLKELKDGYNWKLLNEGTHEEECLPEFEMKDIVGLCNLVERIEKEVIDIKFKTALVK